jgi:hypothetical protein
VTYTFVLCCESVYLGENPFCKFPSSWVMVFWLSGQSYIEHLLGDSGFHWDSEPDSPRVWFFDR